MAASGTIELGGKQYGWESPSIQQLITFEAIKGRLIGTDMVDSIDGIAYLAEACLRKNHPEMTAGIILGLPAEEIPKLRAMVLEAVPFWGNANRAGDLSTDSSSRRQPDTDGSPPPSEESASPTS